MAKIHGNETAVRKSQPWKILIPQGPDQEQLRDISTLTDRPWARLMLAQRYSKLADGPRQHRYPDYDKDRKVDPFKGLYKAESKCELKKEKFLHCHLRMSYRNSSPRILRYVPEALNPFAVSHNFS